MTRKTIDFGIDLGTTNSVVAVIDGEQPRVIKNTLGEDITPSFVNAKEINGRVLVTVGTRAKNLAQLDSDAYAQVASKFKKRMGQAEWRHEFNVAGGGWNAPMLSAEMLKYLLDSVQGRFKERPDSAVITVPAAFVQSAYEATAKAAELAGLAYVELLEEPVAAALAYGLQNNPDAQQDWLVYDLGGGTFDAAIVHSEDGIFTVVDHDGIRNLGGSDLDDEIVNQFLLQQYPPELRTERLRTVLYYYAEDAKISLAIDDVYLFQENIFGHVSSDIEITREEIALLGIKLFEPTVKICKQLLERNDIDRSHLGRIILVGGQTQSPFLRKWLEESLGLQVDISVDPLTAVAQGAAIYAGTRLNRNNRAEGAEPKDKREGSIDEYLYELEINAQHATTEEEMLVTGAIKTRLGESLPSGVLSVQMHRVDQSGQTLWESDPLFLDGEGRFYGSVKLRPGENLFNVILKVEAEGLVDLANSQFSIRRQKIGADHNSKINRGLGVVDSDGRMIWFFKRDDHLPDIKKQVLYTSKTLKKGEKGAMLDIPIVDGNYDLGELNTPSSHLLIRAENIHCDIPEGTCVEVSIAVDESRLMSIDGYVEKYDIDIEGESIPGMDLTHEELKKDLGMIGKVVQEAIKAADSDVQLMAVLDEIGWDQKIDMLEDLVKRGNGENPDPWQRAKEMLIDIKRQLWPHRSRIEQLINWKNYKYYCDKNMGKAIALMEAMPELPGTAKSDFARLLENYERAVNEMDHQTLERIAYGALPDLFLGVEELRDLVAHGADQRPDKVSVTIDFRKGDVNKERLTLTDG
ncbi:MAG: Hsp70 family protein [Candidatus Thiodiazotropha sp. (ex Lucinoma borealis)]|nr:Hsp70 family protein [Candidatus Thiodiazotropha sp. (ex Lucinoma borealis)]